MKVDRYRLSLSTFGGVVPGAFHYFARIRYTENGKTIEVDLGKDSTGRYARRSSAIRAARAWFDEHAPLGSFLTEGPYAVLDPQEIIAGPSSLRRQANALWREFEKLDGWGAPRSDHPRVQAICDSWDAVLKTYWRELARDQRTGDQR